MRRVLLTAVCLSFATMTGVSAVYSKTIPHAAKRGERPQQFSYGADKRQVVDFYGTPKSTTRAPLVLYVHGGGWRNGDEDMVAEKPAFFAQNGMAFGSIGYRLLPDAPVETQAQDVADAVRFMRAKAAQLGFDGNKIILVGHSAGAHLVALISTDPRYLGDAFDSILGTMPIDGAGYDVAKQMAESRMLSKRIYTPAFGTDPKRQKELSPVTHVGGRDVPHWFLLFSSERKDSPTQNRLLGDALQSQGVTVERLSLPLSHRSINVDFGTKGFGANEAIIAWLQTITA